MYGRLKPLETWEIAALTADALCCTRRPLDYGGIVRTARFVRQAHFVLASELSCSASVSVPLSRIPAVPSPAAETPQVEYRLYALFAD